jgi:hypothetical protein
MWTHLIVLHQEVKIEFYFLMNKRTEKNPTKLTVNNKFLVPSDIDPQIYEGYEFAKFHTVGKN